VGTDIQTNKHPGRQTNTQTDAAENNTALNACVVINVEVTEMMKVTDVLQVTATEKINRKTLQHVNGCKLQELARNYRKPQPISR